MGDVKFIRKNGRIIPIKVKDHHKGVAGLAGAGLVTGAGGYIAGKKIRKAEKISQMTFDFMNDKPFSKLPKGVIDVHDGFFKARTKLNVARKFAVGSRWAGSGLAFYGLTKLMKNEKDSTTKEMSKIAVAGIASEVVSRGIYAGFKRKLPFSLALNTHAKSSGVSLIKAFVKKKLF